MATPNSRFPSWIAEPELLKGNEGDPIVVAEGSLLQCNKCVDTATLIVKSVEWQGNKKYILRQMTGQRLLDHRSIVPLTEVVFTSTHVCFCSPRGGDMNLLDYVAKHGPLPEERALSFFHQMVAAVDHCHSVGYLHRNIDLTNFVVDAATNKVRMCGCTYLKPGGGNNSLPSGTSTAGDFNFKAPEFFIAQEGPASDVFSLGACLAHMLLGLGIRVHAGRTPDGGERSIWGDDGSVELSQPARHLLSQLLKVDPNERMTMAQIWVDDWFSQGDVLEYIVYNREMMQREHREQFLQNTIQDSDIENLRAKMDAPAPGQGSIYLNRGADT